MRTYGRMIVYGKKHSISLVNLIASELGYTVRYLWLPNMEVLVFECDDGQFHSFLGVNRFELALQWLRHEV